MVIDFNQFKGKKYSFKCANKKKTQRNGQRWVEFSVFLNTNKAHKFYMDSRIFINTPPTMGLTLNRTINI